MQSFHFKKEFFLLACFFNCSFLYAQFILQKFTKINEENGLSDNNVQCVYKDSKQFVWIGTKSGVDLMNGSGITIFKHDRANSNSISNNNITAIAGDSNGLIWIGTGKGLNSFNPSLHLFSYFSLQNFKNNPGYVTALVTDKTNNIYVGTRNGLFFLKAGEKKAHQIEMPGLPAQLQKNNFITGLAFDSSGKLWITSFNGLEKYIPEKKQVEQIIERDNFGYSILFTHLLIDSSGIIWIGTFNHGLKNYDPFKNKFVSFTDTGNVRTLVEVKVASGKKQLWIGGVGGFTILDLSHQKFITQNAQADFPKNLDIQNAYTSNDNWLWIGTDEGLYFWDPSKPVFLHYFFTKKITDQVVPLLEWNGKILAGGAGENFLKSYDKGLIEKDNFSKNIPGIVSCLSLKFSGKYELIAGTSEGIATINLVNHKVRFNHLRFLAKNIYSGNFITNLLLDSEYRLWIFPWRQGIWRSDSTRQNFSQVFKNFINENGNPKSLVVSDVIEGKNNDLWFADLDEGIINYNKKSNQFSKPFAKQLGNFYSCNQIVAHQNWYYSFIASEILEWGAYNKSLQIIPLPPEIDEPITAIAFDSSNHLWIATEKGLLEYDPGKKVFKRFTTADGLISNDMDGTLYCKKNGTMIFASPVFLTSFEPEKLLAYVHHAPHLRLVEIMVNGKFIPLTQIGKMNFNHEQNNITVKWAVTDYNSPLKNHYYYQLKDIDDAWRNAGDRGEINLVSLSPGNYTLLLKGENSNSIPADNLIKLFFKIRLPFWRTWWFVSAVILFFVSLFYFFYRFRLKEVRRTEKLRNKIARDLHDDVGATLSTIMLYGNSIKKKAGILKKEDIMNIVNKINLSAGKMIDEMNDIVWTINPKNDNMSRTINRMQIFASTLLASKEVSMNFIVDEEIKNEKVSMDKRKNCYLIFKEVLNNAMKYSECTEICISLNKNHHNVEMKITDNGKGFNLEDHPAGNGLDNIRQRASEIDGKLNIYPIMTGTQQVTGTSVSLIFPLS